MNNKRLEEIKERLNAVTKGRWEWEDDNYDKKLVSDKTTVMVSRGSDDRTSTIMVSEEDAGFIAHSKEDIQYLLNLVEQYGETLKFYAADYNYNDTLIYNGGYKSIGASPVVKDSGKRARKILKEQ